MLSSFIIRVPAKSIVLAVGCAFGGTVCIQCDIVLYVFSSWICTGMPHEMCVPYDSY